MLNIKSRNYNITLVYPLLAPNVINITIILLRENMFDFARLQYTRINSNLTD